jgi:hypothetical protein
VSRTPAHPQQAVQLALQVVRSSTGPGEATRRPALALAATLGLLVMCSSLPAVGATAFGASSGYGKLIASSRVDALGTPKASFHGVRPARSFRLVAMSPGGTQLSVNWSITCSDPAHKASGGASGEATIVHGRWSKLVRADWIKHPSFCSGRLEGALGSASLRLRAYAE